MTMDFIVKIEAQLYKQKMYLNCHTYYSLRYGTFSETELLEIGKEHGLKSLVLADINNTSGCLNFIRLSREFGIKPIVGIDFRNGNEPCFVGIAKNNDGFKELNDYLSYFLHQKQRIPSLAPAFKNVFVIYPFRISEELEIDSLLPHEFIGIAAHEIPQLRMSRLLKYQKKLVILQTVTFRTKRDFNAHRLLRAIDNNTLLSKLPKSEEAHPEEKMTTEKELINRFEEFPLLIKNTWFVLDNSSIHFDFSAERVPQNQSVYTQSKEEDITLLRKLTEEGLPYRYGNEVTTEIRERIEKELDLIIKQGYVSYFLINWDIISYAKRMDYFHIGRGSGANSIVAYLLRITDVDPIELDLYFERFLNLYRKNPPDFDIDFSWKDRQDVTRYIFERFNHVSLLATYNCFQYKGTVRELGKVFGLPKEEIDKLSSGKFLENRLDELALLVLRYGNLIQGFPNHLGIHAGGILISNSPLHHFSATNLPPKGFPTVQFDMVIAEDVGLFKFDILGQRGLAKIKEAVQIIKENQPERANFDIHDVKAFKKDPKINTLIEEAKCLGCFYVESPAMRMLLKKLRTNTYLGLVAASSIIRPGVSQSGMMREYILRHRFPERIKQKAHPVMLEIMPETYGVMVYQEDVIKVAHLFAGLSLGEADVLRRGMSGKFRSRGEFDQVKQKFIDNCRQKGYEDEMIFEIWRQTESFAGYAFAKGHSASYAVESYQSLFLKTYFPLEYMVAVINNGGGFYRKETYLHELKMLGGIIHPPHINYSRAESVLKGKDVYLGLDTIHELLRHTITEILESRKGKLFIDLDDFMKRTSISIAQAELLVRAGCFNEFDPNKRSLLWKLKLNYSPELVKKEQTKLFELNDGKEFEIPSLDFDAEEVAFDQLELFGFTLGNPFDLMKDEITDGILASEVKYYVNRKVEIYGYLVTVKSTRTVNKKRMQFGTFLDQEGEFIDTVHFPNTVEKYLFRGMGIYKLYGKITEEFDFLTLEVHRMEKMDMVVDPRYAE